MPEAATPAPSEAEIVDSDSSQLEETQEIQDGLDSEETIETETQPMPEDGEEYEFTVNGKTSKRKLTKAERQKLFQQGLAAQEKWQKLAELEKAARQERQERQELAKKYAELEASLKSPDKVAGLLGDNARPWAEKLIADAVIRDNMDPAQLKMQELEAKLAKYEASDKERQEAIAKEKEAAEAKAAGDAEEAALVTALTQANLPKTAAGLKVALEVATDFMEAGQPWRPENLAREIKKRMLEGPTSALHQWMAAFEDDQALVKSLPADLRKRLRQGELALAKIAKSQPKEKPLPEPKAKNKGYLTPAEFDRWLNEVS